MKSVINRANMSDPPHSRWINEPVCNCAEDRKHWLAKLQSCAELKSETRSDGSANNIHLIHLIRYSRETDGCHPFCFFITFWAFWTLKNKSRTDWVCLMSCFLLLFGLESGGMNVVSWRRREVCLVLEHISLCWERRGQWWNTQLLWAHRWPVSTGTHFRCGTSFLVWLFYNCPALFGQFG